MTARAGRLTRTLLALVAVGLAAPRWSAGHGGVSMEKDICKLRVGPYVMHFTGYQPDSTAEREFCEDIPATGRTVIVLDYIDERLRDLPVEVRIIRDTGNESDLESVTLYHKPPEVYAKGSLAIEHTFSEPGRFVGLVTVGDQVARFPFAVGTRGRRTILLYALFAAGAVAVGGLLFFYSSRNAMVATALAATLLAGPRGADAHARLLQSDPPKRSALATSPAKVRLWFSEAIEPSFVHTTVSDSSGKALTSTSPGVDPSDPKVLVLDLPKLAPGTYTVSYEVVSVDGHRVKGSFSFSVKEPAAREQ